jgi:lipid-A-disaccharide synthase
MRNNTKTDFNFLMTDKPKKILLVTGEASGDHHGALVVKALRRMRPDVRVEGIGGQELAAAGMQLIYHVRDLSVVGLLEILPRAGNIITAYRLLKKQLSGPDKPDLLMLIDYPDFNLRIAAIAKKNNVPVLYYISPQIWAWRQGRAKKIARLVDTLGVIFPFEVAFYEKVGLDARFVGHPLLDHEIQPGDPQEEIRRFGLTGSRPVIGLLPGSRPSEIDRLLEPMLDAAVLIKQRFPEAGFAIPVAHGISGDHVRAMAKQRSIAAAVVEDSFYQVLAVCDLVLVASGTATLQTALMGKPMIIIYKVSPLTYLVGRIMIKVPWIGLANIVAGKQVVPELIQNEASPQRIAAEACCILEDPARMAGMREGLAGIRQALGEPGGSQRVAEIIIEKLKN